MAETELPPPAIHNILTDSMPIVNNICACDIIQLMKSFTNEEIARLLRSVAGAYVIKNEAKYRFQILAYQKAADAIDSSSKEVKDLLLENKLSKIPGIGESIKKHLTELFEKGEVGHFNEILNEISPAVFPLLDIPSFGPKKAFKLISAFGLKDPKTVIDKIYNLASENKIAPLDSFGEKSQADIITAIDEYRLGKTKSSRMVLPLAQEIADDILEYLRKNKDVVEAYPLGSLRRKKSTIGDVDIAVTSKNPQKVLTHFVNYPYKDRIIEKGDITASIVLSGNKQIDLMVLSPDQIGSLLQHFTGSKEHNVKLREYALKKGFSLSEKGIKLKDGTLKKFSNEKDFYNFLGIDWIEPEMRENKGEIEAALQQAQGIRPGLPKLVKLEDIKGDFHIHSNFPIDSSHDYGKDSMQTMIDKAISLGYKYIGFSEHNPSVGNHSESEVYKLLAERNKKIEQLRKSNKNIRIINLLEVDILTSGKLALSDKCLDLLDMAIVSIHSSFKSSSEKMTKRILSGLSHPKAKILAHPTGRLINQRNGYEAFWDKIFEFAKKENKALEINAWPTRLDLRDDLVLQAKKLGCKFVVNTDSHAVGHMDNMKYGVSVARRGWCTKKDILNTLSYSDLASWMKL